MDIHLPPTNTRVSLNTSDRVKRKIAQKTDSNVKKYIGLSGKDIAQRIDALNHEWDTERTLEANFGLVMLVSSLLGYTVNKKWFALGGIASLFMLQHAIQGWCPPLTAVRHLGVRTVEEINQEKESLQKMLSRNPDFQIY
ncbi:MAG TPA: DUF2892 domain-containing protein [Desulfobacteria bacterium]|nr:DUF2892 domain-containing protein [Desulfobacteria bacterium]